jgi:ATP-binding cassette subfamily B protein
MNLKLLILDEATSSIDPYTELVIQNALKNLLENRMAIIIAHRLSTIRLCDEILVIDHWLML